MQLYLTRDVTPEECEWLDETIKSGSTVYRFYGATYGCIGSGVAVTFNEDGHNPFFEIPRDALEKSILEANNLIMW